MAQRDLDAALQLLADRAQYITGATGAAIALRRDGRDDMLCRASVGSNAPELGALLSTEFGLSGESVRTRQLLRCDDAERDMRVNREVCRQMGIASVLVMPVVNDDQVLGVFELFSGKANAFGERDLTAVQRLSEMVETAVRLAHVTETLPEHLSERESAIAEAVHPEVFEGQFLGDLVVEEVKQPGAVQSVEAIAAAALESPFREALPAATAALPKPMSRETGAPVAPETQAVCAPHATVPAKKPLFWSAAAAGDRGAMKPSEEDQSHVPPVLRGLSKCVACGFPISGGRVLCVECEEKKWRGQLRAQALVRRPNIGVAAVPPSRPTGGSFAAAAPTMARVEAAPQDATGPYGAVATVSPTVPLQAEPEPAMVFGQTELILSAGLEPSRSWLSTSKYIILALLVIGTAVAAFLAFR